MLKRAEFPHLPAGREPGPQSIRSRSQRSSLWLFVGVVGTGMYAAGVWLAAGGRGPKFDRQEELLGGLFFVVMGLLAVYVALAYWEGGRPRRVVRLRGVSLVASDMPRRGHELSVTFAGRRSDDGRVEVGLVCDERCDVAVPVSVKGVATTLRQIGEETVREEWQPLPPGVVEHTFTFVVPADAPYSYEGECVSFAWRVSARAVRALREDQRFDQPIWVEP